MAKMGSMRSMHAMCVLIDMPIIDNLLLAADVKVATSQLWYESNTSKPLSDAQKLHLRRTRVLSQSKMVTSCLMTTLLDWVLCLQGTNLSLMARSMGRRVTTALLVAHWHLHLRCIGNRELDP
jgi:hypothetical protein